MLERLDRLEAAHPRVLARTLGISFTSDLVALDAVCVAERARAANRVDLARMAEARERSA